MKKVKKIIILIVMLFLMNIVNINQFIVYADAPYKTFTQDGYSNYVETQTAYMPVGIITSIGEIRLNKPSDIQLASNGLLYIADTGNRRVVVSSTNGELMGIIGQGILQSPKGLFVTDDNKIYVADETAEKVFVFSQTGDLITEYGRPQHPLFGDTSPFKPQKVVVDKRGNVYVISQGNYNGIIQISPSEGGTFLGYFGTNETRIDFLTLFRRTILTEEQRQRMRRSVPSTPTNLWIDEKGLVYTVTQGDREVTLKKLNMAGNNIIHPTVYDRFPADVVTGPVDNIYVASKNGFIYEYTREGNLLFVFGGRDDGRQRIGLFKSVSAITIDQKNKNLYVLDEEKAEIQIFEPTEFTNLVHEALMLYQNGLYLESKELWENVLRMNSTFDLANLGIGEALFREENYYEALKAYRLAKYKPGYSDAFWEIRNIWLKNNLVYLIMGLIIFYVAVKIIKFIDKKYMVLRPVKFIFDKIKQISFIRQLTFIWCFIKRPADGYYGIKIENKVGYLASIFLLLMFFVVFVIDKYGRGFIFRTVQEGVYDIFIDASYVFGGSLLLIISNYLVSTINDGDGKFKHIFCGFVYSLAPYFIIKPFIIILSHILTLNESFLIHFSDFIVYVWVTILFIVMVKQINDYSLRETFKVIFLTLFTALIIVLILFIVYVLVSQVIDFISSIFGEAVYRIENR